MGAPKQRLIVLFDGTWNDPQDRTNVYRLCRNIQDYDGDVYQRFFYDPGVGTSTWSRLCGGLFGMGLSKNLLEGYDWLVRRYLEGDDIYIFGFSRGAYTARSLVGMIRKCGLLHVATPELLAAAKALYRKQSAAPDEAECREFRDRYSRVVQIHFLGVWDTVGALGVPGTAISERGFFSWHDTALSKIVKRAYQALAIDEHRAAYDSVLWVGDNGKKKPEQLDVEQRWFIGSHANVGGGYGVDPLADISLAWMQEKAGAAGLKLQQFSAPPDAYRAPITDSFRKFLSGIYAQYRKLRGRGRHYRRIAVDENGALAVGVTVDPSVWQRWKAYPKYRPPTLVGADVPLP